MWNMRLVYGERNSVVGNLLFILVTLLVSKAMNLSKAEAFLNIPAHIHERHTHT